MTLLQQIRPALTGNSCILFDMDGTLLDSAPGVTASAAHALATVGAPVPSMDKLRRFVGPPMIESFRTVSQLDEKPPKKLSNTTAESTPLTAPNSPSPTTGS